MSAGAWIMLGITWSVVIGVSGYLFWKVVTRPLVRPEDGGDAGGESGAGDEAADEAGEER